MQDFSFLSLSDRDRRHKLVRQAMREQGLDALLIWGDSGKWDWKIANIHYLTQVGGNGEEGLLLFPLEEEPTLILWSGSPGLAEEWRRYSSWITDVRPRTEGMYFKAIVERIKELKLAKSTIGLPGLVEGERVMLPSGIFNSLRAELPKADFRDASDILEGIREVKSPEEIAFMERATQIGEAAIDTMAKMAMPGVPENEVVGAMLNTMIVQGAELPIMFLWDAGRPIRALRRTFTQRRLLQPGDIICSEFSPRFHGYCPQLNQPAVVGDFPAKYERLYTVAIESYRRGWAALKPDITVGELVQAFHEPVVAAGLTWGSPYFHGVGMGNEGPLGMSPFRGKAASTIIREGMVLAFEPGAATPDHKMGLHIGDPVLVTRNGPRRLGKREPRIVVIK